MPKYLDGPLDLVFRALSDPLRRQMVQRLRETPATVGELAALGPVTLPTAMQHLEALAKAGLVSSSKAGRVRSYALVPGSLDAGIAWMQSARTPVEQRLDRLTRHLKEND
ncbi:MAG: metalloregulator ArsR/SmtB family transcription factor [Tetrasphaera sp.]